MPAPRRCARGQRLAAHGYRQVMTEPRLLAVTRVRDHEPRARHHVRRHRHIRIRAFGNDHPPQLSQAPRELRQVRRRVEPPVSSQARQDAHQRNRCNDQHQPLHRTWFPIAVPCGRS